MATLMFVWSVEFQVADFGEASCSLLLAVLFTYSGKAIGWNRADPHHDGSSM
jgi:hypothetical protein